MLWSGTRRSAPWPSIGFSWSPVVLAARRYPFGSFILSLSLSLSLSSLRLLAGSVDVLVSVPTRKPVLYCVVEVVSFVCRFIIIIIIFFCWNCYSTVVGAVGWKAVFPFQFETKREEAVADEITKWQEQSKIKETKKEEEEEEEEEATRWLFGLRRDCGCHGDGEKEVACSLAALLAVRSGFNPVLPSFHCRAPALIEFYRVSFQVVPDSSVFFPHVLLALIEFQWVLLGFNGLY